MARGLREGSAGCCCLEEDEPGRPAGLFVCLPPLKD